VKKYGTSRHTNYNNIRIFVLNIHKRGRKYREVYWRGKSWEEMRRM
jgi:hypothetical protein